MSCTYAVNVTYCSNVDGLLFEVTDTVGVALFTTCVNTADVSLIKLESPEYAAVRECEPALNVESTSIALPLPFNVPIPIESVPSKNLMVPEGVPLPGGFAVTVAQIVSTCSNAEGLSLELSTVVVESCNTVCMNVADVLVKKFELPLYTATIECGLAGTERVATPLLPTPLTRATVVSVLPSMLKVTLPVGVPDPGGFAETVAVSVTS